MKEKSMEKMPYAGNPHVRFADGKVESVAKPRRGSLLYKRNMMKKGYSGMWHRLPVMAIMMFVCISISRIAFSDTIVNVYHSERLAHVGSMRMYLLITVSIAMFAFVCVLKTTRKKMVLWITCLCLLVSGGVVYLISRNSSISANYDYICNKCGAKFKESDLLGVDDPNYAIVQAGPRSGNWGEHYKYDCPKCSGWRSERQHARQYPENHDQKNPAPRFSFSSTTKEWSPVTGNRLR